MSYPTLPPLPARAAAGAALLDQREPGWYEAIDPDQLAVPDPGRVLLDYLAARFHAYDPAATLTALSGTFTSHCDPGVGVWLASLGFELAPGEVAAERLAGCWQAEVRRRQATPRPASPTELRPGDPLAALADHLDPPDHSAVIEVEWPAAAAIVAELGAARAVIGALLDMPGRSEHDDDGLDLVPGERTVEAWWHQAAVPALHAYDCATGAGPTLPPAGTWGVLVAVAAERARQDARWGDQNVAYRGHPDALTVLVEEVGEVARAILDHEQAAVRAEAVQVAAVAVALVEGTDRAQVASPSAVAP